MTEINLLPWREQKREQEKKQFMTYLLTGLVLAMAVVFLVNYYATYLVNGQTERNQRLKNEIATLEAHIRDISTLKKLRAALIARMNVIQNLQATRILTVHLLDEIMSIIPDGIHLYEVKRERNKVTLLGYSESNTHISQLMRRIEESVWVQDPELNDIKKITDKKGTTLISDNEFKLSFILKSKTMLGSKV
jgi:type IV pilus assembly protein PilN